MKKINYLIAGILIFAVMSVMMSSAMTLSYNFNNDSSKPIVKITSSSFELTVNTGQSDAICRYGLNPANYTNLPNNFISLGDGNYKAIFNDLSDGQINTYYVKCNSSVLNGSEPPTLSVPVRVDLPVSVTSISFPDVSTSTLPAGRLELDLQTSKLVQGTPTLQYSFDGKDSNWNNLPLFGSGTDWYTYIIIPNDIQSGAVYFKFKGIDLEGNPGSDIKNGGVFPIDTVKPVLIADITATGLTGSVGLNWHIANSNDVVKYNIYRSTSPGVDYTDYYTSVYGRTAQVYTDYAAQKGQTYYYRVAAVDEAGNIADLSKEVYATSLRNNVSVNTTSGLSPSLVGNVENFLVSADAVISNINEIKTSLPGKSQSEQSLFADMGFKNQLDSTINQINGIERDAKALELQDLTEQQLTDKLNALSVKLDIAKRQVPEDITILSNTSDSYVPTENDVIKALLEFNSSLSQSEISKSSRAAVDYIKNSGMTIDSKYYVLQVVYLDGTTQDLSVVSRSIGGEVSRMPNAYFIENIPKDVASDVSSLNFPIGSYTTIQSDPIVSFGTDTKRILYYIQGDESLQTLQGAQLSFIMLANQTSGISFTGYILKGVNSGLSIYGGIIIGVLIVAGLLVYFFIFKKRKLSDKGIEILGMTREINDYVKDKDAEKAKSMYSEVKDKYKELDEKEKKILYKKIKLAYDKLSEIKSSGDKKNEIKNDSK